MRVKAGNPVELLTAKEVSPILRAYFELNQLKGLYRQGWLRAGLDEAQCETVADHTFAVALLSLWLAQAYFPGLDLGRLVQIALLHELGEIYAGDITPADGLTSEEKHRREADSVRRVLSGLPFAETCQSLWQEFEDSSSTEARLVRQVDRLEMGLQAGVYARRDLLDPAEFLQSAREALSEEALICLLDELECLNGAIET